MQNMSYIYHHNDLFTKDMKSSVLAIVILHHHDMWDVGKLNSGKFMQHFDAFDVFIYIPWCHKELIISIYITGL